jgi:hypothetical protein
MHQRTRELHGINLGGRHENQKGRCERKAGAKLAFFVRPRYRAMDNPMVSQYLSSMSFYPNNLVWASQAENLLTVLMFAKFDEVMDFRSIRRSSIHEEVQSVWPLDLCVS